MLDWRLLQAHHYVTARIILDVTEFAASSSTITGGVGSVTGIAPSSMQALAKNNAKANDKILQRKATAKATSAVDDPSDNSDSFAVPITDLPKADLGVTATAVSGAKVGDTVTINANVANHGPNLAAGIYVMITVPSNTGFAAISQVCQHTSNARRSSASTRTHWARTSRSTSRSRSRCTGTPGSDGSLTVHGSAVDLSSANNSASLSIALDTATATTAANASNTGTLPVTGDKVGLYAFGGALLLLMGGALTITARRRRSA
ncbi:LPXTG cell wall anchor domain-containing protein [Fodinicola feengrottensis]|uniref:LPXTG cell wall anchor domain-containing protein n=1 Tax=Fodinicola feengrottensis TaxID=435914 RepID=UPI0013D64C71|nr:LPXTG cell wall anchor domain-containing protein [Fodinicola feengrottensis]